MKFSPKVKKILGVAVLLAFVITLTGCSVPRDANNNIILITSDTTFKSIMSDENWFSAIFVWPLAQWINHMAPHIGVPMSIVVVTVVVNGVLALLTLKSTVASQQMQLLQPELERIQRKYEGRDDQNSKMRQAAEMQALYKKYNVNPGGTLLITFIQFPLLIAMYMAVQRSAAVANGKLMGVSLQNTPLQGFRDAFSGNVAGWILIILFIFMAICQFLSMWTPMHLQKKRAEADAEKHHRKPQESSSQQKIMQYYMMGMILIFGLMWPAAMSLYWAINSLVNVVKTLLIQKYIDSKNLAAERK